MSFCNIEYLQERLAAVCKERDEYKSLLNAAISAQESLQKELHETKSELERLRGEKVVYARWNANGRCTNCGGHAPYWAMSSAYYKSPYCFECGARMEGEE